MDDAARSPFPWLYATAAQARPLSQDEFDAWVRAHPGFGYAAADAYCRWLTPDQRADFAADPAALAPLGDAPARAILDALRSRR